jgi:hypothetical protein
VEGAGDVTDVARVVRHLVLLSTLPTALAAQAPSSRPTPEVRADLITGVSPAIQLGIGEQIPLGIYARLGAVGAIGARLDDVGPGSRLDGRVDLLGRFLFDPYRQNAWGVSLGGGLSARFEPAERVRPLLLLAIDVEGRRSARGVSPAIQLALGGGVRLGVVLRRGETGRR